MSGVYPEDKWVSVNGLSLHYLDWGGDRTKKPLILMHGIGGHAHMFDEFAPRMTDKWHVVALDARGCGDSDWSREGYSAQSFASDVGMFALATGLYPFDYYGHSQGSRIGMPLGGLLRTPNRQLGTWGLRAAAGPFAGWKTDRRGTHDERQSREAKGLLQRPYGFRLAP